MAIERVKWQCPQCGKKYAIPANLPRPAVCPKCQPETGPVFEPATSSPLQMESSDLQQSPVEFQAVEPTPSLPLPTVSPAAGEPAPSLTKRKYPGLRLISLCFKILAVLIGIVAIMGVFLALKASLSADGAVERTTSILMGLYLFGAGTLGSLMLLAVGELILVFLDIEENTRRMSFYLPDK